jgi:hypothetical protein
MKNGILQMKTINYHDDKLCWMKQCAIFNWLITLGLKTKKKNNQKVYPFFLDL